MYDIIEKHLYLEDDVIRDLVNNNDLRFFKHKKHLLNSLLCAYDGLCVKACSWDCNILLKSYELCNKIHHANIPTYFCYFECEFDIFAYMLAEDVEHMNDIAVIVSPNYQKCEFDVDRSQKVLQLVYLLYFLLFQHGIGFHTINVNKIYCNHIGRKSRIKYHMFDKCFQIATTHVVIFDNFLYSYKVTNVENSDIQNLYSNILLIFATWDISIHFDRKSNHLDLLQQISDFLCI